MSDQQWYISHVFRPLISTGMVIYYMDDFSAVIWQYATMSTTTYRAITCLDRQQQIFGNPTRVISDRGIGFTSMEFSEYCSAEGIEHVTITDVHKGNGQIERMNRRIIHWDNAFPSASGYTFPK